MQRVFNHTVPTYIEITEGKWQGLKGYIKEHIKDTHKYVLTVYKEQKACKLVVDVKLCKRIGGAE